MKYRSSWVVSFKLTLACALADHRVDLAAFFKAAPASFLPGFPDVERVAIAHRQYSSAPRFSPLALAGASDVVPAHGIERRHDCF